ncbi:2-phospho-L-lactate transferase [Haliangium sp.]|uniref:2-phospho-L-lactate transferase n=1 Tax=Haliangium sp. TaxID=2663208 RepID=UPI003D1059F3
MSGVVRPRVVALSGGVGGARFVRGLAAVVPDDELAVVVNTGDDFTWWGLTICPDLDTVMYTLSGLGHEARGWGLAEETFHALAMVERLGGPAWFQLGDRDLATHLMRTQALAAGDSLTAVTARLCHALGVGPRIVPMTDQPRRTMIDTVDDRTLLLQEWLVRERARPAVAGVRFEGTDQPADAALSCLHEAELVLIGPSNPYVSVDPILTLAGVREAVAGKLVVAVSPIVGGRAVKGPLAEMITQLSGAAPSAAAVRAHYGELLAGFVVHDGDQADSDPGLEAVPVLTTDIVMPDRAASERVARAVLDFCARL